MAERKNAVTMHGKPLTLIGNEIKEGMPAPDCFLVDQNLNSIHLSSFKGKVIVLITVPSLDTPVCSIETRRFNQEAAKWKDQVETVVVSMDLPFAQKRWCGSEGVKNLQVLSDFQKREVGENYGVLIKDVYLLARAVFIIDAEGKIRYAQIVKEITQEPDYNQVISNIAHLLAGAR